jgi:hypothetical protein
MRRLPLVLLCLLPLGLATIWYATNADATLPIVQFELAGSAGAAARIVDGRTGAFRDALTADYVFMAGYALTMSAACLLALRRAGATASRPVRLAWGFAAVAAALAAVFDLVENLNLAHGLTVMTDGPFGRAAAFATAKFVLLLPTIVISVAALVRAARSRSARV